MNPTPLPLSSSSGSVISLLSNERDRRGSPRGIASGEEEGRASRGNTHNYIGEYSPFEFYSPTIYLTIIIIIIISEKADFPLFSVRTLFFN
jgi:hypothetical protein